MDAVMRMVRSLLASRTLWLVVGAAGLLSLANVARRGLMRDPRFMARPEFRGARVPGWSGRELLDPVMLHLDAMGPVSLLDIEFEDRVRAALAHCAPIRKIVQVRRHWPRNYSVQVVFHRPVAVVQPDGERDGARLPVTHDLVVLPVEAYRHASKGLYEIRGVRGPAPAAGTVWQSEALADGLATLRQLAPYLNRLRPLEIETIDVSHAVGPRGCVMLRTARGIPVRWGRPRAPVGENSVAQKVRFLLTAMEQIERLDGYEIDVRYNRIFLRRSIAP